MTKKTIVLISSTIDTSADGFLSRLSKSLVTAGCQVERTAASDAERILDLLESGAVPVFLGGMTDRM
ncbi:MAG: hypothetical protein M0R77_14370 [Gammaproteobacteria bacterium]|nr:hypothetical protein [Gammaproteobacteria bacterium]